MLENNMTKKASKPLHRFVNNRSGLRVLLAICLLSLLGLEQESDFEEL